MQRPPYPWIAIGMALACGQIAMLLARPAPGRMAPFLVAYLATFGVYLLAVRRVLSAPSPATERRLESDRNLCFPVILGLGALLRLMLLPAPPLLSHDLSRYLWDGRVVLAGENPYLEPPASSFSTHPPGSEFSQLEHREVPTIYPPAAQLLFAAGAALWPGVLGIKVLIVLADLGIIVLLRTLLRARGLPEARVLIYAWNPLAITETAWSGHLEPVAILCVLLAAGAIIQKREARAAIALGVGVLVKLFPLVLLVPLFRSMRARVLLLVPLLLTAAYWPFRAAGWRILAGLRIYADRWLGNESLFAILLTAIEWIDPTPALKSALAWVRRSVPHTEALDPLYHYVYPIDLTKGLCGLLLLAWAIWIVKKRIEPLRGCFLLTGAFLILSPTVHPWYLLWILPWLCLFPSRAFLLLTGLSILAYLNLGAASRESEPYAWIRLVEYVPFYALWWVDWVRAGAGRRVPSPHLEAAGTG